MLQCNKCDDELSGQIYDVYVALWWGIVYIYITFMHCSVHRDVSRSKALWPQYTAFSYFLTFTNWQYISCLFFIIYWIMMYNMYIFFSFAYQIKIYKTIRMIFVITDLHNQFVAPKIYLHTGWSIVLVGSEQLVI